MKKPQKSFSHSCPFVSFVAHLFFVYETNSPCVLCASAVQSASSSPLRRRELRDELRQFLRARTLAAAHEIPAQRHAGAQTLAQVEPQHPPQAEARVEVVARAGADLRFVHERPGEESRLLRRRRRGASSRMNDRA